MKIFNYHPSSLPIPKHLAPEKTLDVSSEVELIAELAKIAAVQPALLFTTVQKAANILAQMQNAVKVTKDTSPSLLRCVDQCN